MTCTGPASCKWKIVSISISWYFRVRETEQSGNLEMIEKQFYFLLVTFYWRLSLPLFINLIFSPSDLSQNILSCVYIFTHKCMFIIQHPGYHLPWLINLCSHSAPSVSWCIFITPQSKYSWAHVYPSSFRIVKYNTVCLLYAFLLLFVDMGGDDVLLCLMENYGCRSFLQVFGHLQWWSSNLSFPPTYICPEAGRWRMKNEQCNNFWWVYFAEIVHIYHSYNNKWHITM